MFKYTCMKLCLYASISMYCNAYKHVLQCIQVSGTTFGVTLFLSRLLGCRCAAGEQLPPYILCKGKIFYSSWMAGGPAGALFGVSKYSFHGLRKCFASNSTPFTWSRSHIVCRRPPLTSVPWAYWGGQKSVSMLSSPLDSCLTAPRCDCVSPYETLLGHSFKGGVNGRKMSPSLFSCHWWRRCGRSLKQATLWVRFVLLVYIHWIEQ